MLRASTVERYKKLSVSTLKRKAKTIFNAWIRERDREGDYFTCVSCRKKKRIIKSKGQSNFHAGHFYPAGQYESLRFDEVNVNGECSACNYYSGDHLIGYRKSIIERHGEKELERIEMLAAYSKRAPKKWMRIELIEIIQKYS